MFKVLVVDVMVKSDNDKGIWVGIGPLLLTPCGRSHLYYVYILHRFYKKSTLKREWKLNVG